MKRTTVVVIGGGQAGLATSACLSERGIDHVVLERGRVAERWRSERWDSFRMLTPRWQSRLPGFRYQGPDPDGYMTRAEVVEYLVRFARRSAAPVQDETTVTSVARDSGGFRVETDRGAWHAANVIVATGHCAVPRVPAFARRLPRALHQLVATRYRNAAQLPPGGVLVVGASASGVQLAHEIAESGRPVSLAVGRHTRLPRRYRGKDLMFWLDRSGVLDEGIDRVRDLEAARRQPSMQLVGRPDFRSLDLAVLRQQGVRLLGRAEAAEGSVLQFADDLGATTAAAEAKLTRLLSDIDRFIARTGMSRAFPDPERPEPFVASSAPARIDLMVERIQTVIWATGFTQRYPWLHVPVLDETGAIRHRGGVTAAPGLYVMGLKLLRRRKSSFLDGVADDANDLVDHLAARLGQRRAA